MQSPYAQSLAKRPAEADLPRHFRVTLAYRPSNAAHTRTTRNDPAVSQASREASNSWCGPAPDTRQAMKNTDSKRYRTEVGFGAGG